MIPTTQKGRAALHKKYNLLFTKRGYITMAMEHFLNAYEIYYESSQINEKVREAMTDKYNWYTFARIRRASNNFYAQFFALMELPLPPLFAPKPKKEFWGDNI